MLVEATLGVGGDHMGSTSLITAYPLPVHRDFHSIDRHSAPTTRKIVTSRESPDTLWYSTLTDLAEGQLSKSLIAHHPPGAL